VGHYQLVLEKINYLWNYIRDTYQETNLSRREPAENYKNKHKNELDFLKWIIVDLKPSQPRRRNERRC